MLWYIIANEQRKSKVNIKKKQNQKEEQSLKARRTMKKTNEKGVTLIALSITIILMVMLAVITINSTQTSDDLVETEETISKDYNNQMTQHMKDINTLTKNINKTTGK